MGRGSAHRQTKGWLYGGQEQIKFVWCQNVKRDTLGLCLSSSFVIIPLSQRYF